MNGKEFTCEWYYSLVQFTKIHLGEVSHLVPSLVVFESAVYLLWQLKKTDLFKFKIYLSLFCIVLYLISVKFYCSSTLGYFWTDIFNSYLTISFTWYKLTWLCLLNMLLEQTGAEQTSISYSSSLTFIILSILYYFRL